VVKEEKMITDEELADLPDDNELAFVVYERRLRNRLREVSTEDSNSAERDYVNHILAFIDHCGLNIEIDRDFPWEDRFFWDWYHRFVYAIDHYTMKARLMHKRGLAQGITTVILLSTDYRTEITKLINKIRKVVNASDFPSAQKDSIYKNLSSLQLEVDRENTRFDAFLSRLLDLTNAVGEGAENLEPLAKLMTRIMRSFGRAKADHDQRKLPPVKERRALPKPASEKSGVSEIDDDIPF
jgi:hypothetical protein